MIETGFYVIELTGDVRWLTYDEIHKVRKDILLYFDENIGESVSVLMPEKEFNLDYWKYISIGSDDKWAESEGYSKLIEEGCLALLNGIALDILDEPINLIRKEWRKISIEQIIPYLENYYPKSRKLEIAKSHLQSIYGFIMKMTESDLNEHGMLKDFNLSIIGKWFDQNIVQDYYRWNLTKYGSQAPNET